MSERQAGRNPPGAAMPYWESNCEILGKHYPGLLEEIARPGGDELDPQDIQIETAASGLPVLIVKGRHVHSPRDPAREGSRLAEAAVSGGDGVTANRATAGQCPIVILGFGLGYSAEAAARLAGERPLVIVEKHRSLLRIAFELRDLKALLLRKNVLFVCGSSGEGLTQALYILEGAEKTSPAVIRNRVLAELDREWYEAVEGRLRTWTMRDDVNAATLKKFGKRWVRNLSRNMSTIRDLPGISGFAGLAASSTPGTEGAEVAEPLPVFLVAAGPGLDSIGAYLPEIRKRCIVVAVDTSLRFLLKHRAEPDFVLVVDPQFWNSRHLDRCAAANTMLVAESAVYPPVLRLAFKNIFLCGSLFPLGSFIERRVDAKGLLGAGGSVATTAWDFARTLGATDIWIAGLDLAFPGLKTHFRGAAFEEKTHAESSRRRPSETWLVRALRDGLPFRAPASLSAGSTDSTGGGVGNAPAATVLTDRRLSLYAAWFENRFRQYPEIRNRSLSSGGLAIVGLEPSAVESLLDLPCRREEINARLAAAVAEIGANYYNAEETRRRAERYENAVLMLTRGLSGIKNAAEQGAKIAEQALRQKPAPAEQAKILAKLDEINRIIAQSEVKEAAGFLFPPDELAKMGNAAHQDKAATPFEVYFNSAVRLYRSLSEATRFNLEEITLKSPANKADIINTGRDNLS